MPHGIIKNSGTIYQAPHQWKQYVQQETGSRSRQYGQLFYLPDDYKKSVWALNIWSNCYQFSYKSINDAVEGLNTIADTVWVPILWTLQDEGAIIAKKTGFKFRSTRTFPQKSIQSSPPSFTILSPGTIIASPCTSAPFAGGFANFEQNKCDPPSSAYLKLEEALVRLGWYPDQTSYCFDAGACPGGWTWVLSKLGSKVYAVDRSPLDNRLLQSPLIEYKKGNAFTDLRWKSECFSLICSDVICYPRDLWNWFEQLFINNASERYILSIKMQGKADWNIIERFESIPNSELYHGMYNKHELTFIYPSPRRYTIKD